MSGTKISNCKIGLAFYPASTTTPCGLMASRRTYKHCGGAEILIMHPDTVCMIPSLASMCRAAEVEDLVLRCVGWNEFNRPPRHFVNIIFCQLLPVAVVRPKSDISLPVDILVRIPRL